MSEDAKDVESVCAACGATVGAGVPFGMCTRCLVESALTGGEDDADLLGGGGGGGAEEPGGEVLHGSIGPYRLTGRIGEGAFGEVFAAVQGEPVCRKVALKLLKRGMDTRQITARFEVERRALALMAHPNVATVFDGGESADGRPFFVLEFVDGPPITEFCEEAGLGLRERLELFRAVCEGVHHAHQKGIIHRDLKPQNVLVDVRGRTGIPKVIDFGIAKVTEQVMTARTIFTDAGRAMGTPAYMSPEQAGGGGGDVDVRSDVYSLGALLYHLVAGRPPFDEHRLRAAGASGMERIIAEEEPPRPTVATGGGGRSDLDWIVMKAIAKDRSERYDSAAALGEEVGRFLEGGAVAARPPTVTYRVRKFARRHRAVLAAAAAVFLASAAGVVAVAQQARRALRAEMAAAERAAISEALYDAINDDLVGVALEGGPMEAFHLGTILDRFEAKVEASLAEHPLVEAGSRLMLARAYFGVYRPDAAERNARRSLLLYRDHVPEPDHRELGAAAILARSLLRGGNAEQALDVIVEAGERAAGIPRGSRADVPIAELLEVQVGALEALEVPVDERLPIHRRLVDHRPEQRDAWRGVMEAHAALAERALAAGDLEEAARQCRRGTILASFINRSGMWLTSSRMSMLALRRRLLAAGAPEDLLVDSFATTARGWDLGEVLGGLELPEVPGLLVEGYVRSRRGEAAAAADRWARAVAGRPGTAGHALLHGLAIHLEAAGRGDEAAAAAESALALVRTDLDVGSAGALYWYAATWQRVRAAAIDAAALPFSPEVVFPGNGHRYRRIEIPLPWDEARAVCERLGGHLATIADEDENRFLHEAFARERVCWLGASDSGGGGTWAWVDGTPWAFEAWASRRPGGEPAESGAVSAAVIGDFRMPAFGVDWSFGSRWSAVPEDGIGSAADARRDPLRSLLVTHAICEWDGEPRADASPTR